MYLYELCKSFWKKWVNLVTSKNLKSAVTEWTQTEFMYRCFRVLFWTAKCWRVNRMGCCACRSLMSPTAVKRQKSPITGPRCPEGSRKLRFPDNVTVAQDGGKVSLTHRPRLPPGNTHSFKGWVDPRAIVRSEGFYVNEKFQWHHLESIERPSDL